MQIVSTSLSFQIKDILQVVNLFLQLLHEGIIGCTELVGAHFRHDLLGSVCELQRGNCLLRVVNDRTHSGDQCCSSIAAETILKQACDLRVPV